MAEITLQYSSALKIEDITSFDWVSHKGANNKSNAGFYMSFECPMSDVEPKLTVDAADSELEKATMTLTVSEMVSVVDKNNKVKRKYGIFELSEAKIVQSATKFEGGEFSHSFTVHFTSYKFGSSSEEKPASNPGIGWNAAKQANA